MNNLTPAQKIAWYEAEIRDAKKWITHFEKLELPTCIAIEKARLRQLENELAALVAKEQQEETK